MTIGEEFEKAYDEFRDSRHKNYPKGAYVSKMEMRSALWAAKWMAIKIRCDDSCGPFMAERISQMAKELQ